jgi:hypothetical protein
MEEPKPVTIHESMVEYPFGLTPEEYAQLSRWQCAYLMLYGTDSLKEPGFPGARKISKEIRLKLTGSEDVPEEPAHALLAIRVDNNEVLENFSDRYDVLQDENGEWEMVKRSEPRLTPVYLSELTEVGVADTGMHAVTGVVDNNS